MLHKKMRSIEIQNTNVKIKKLQRNLSFMQESYRIFNLKRRMPHMLKNLHKSKIYKAYEMLL